MDREEKRMTVPDENRKEIAIDLAFIALLPIDNDELKNKLAHLVADVAVLIGGEEFMRELLEETKTIYGELLGRGVVQ